MSELKRKSQDQLKKESRQRMNERRLNESPEETQKRQKYDALYVSSFFILCLALFLRRVIKIVQNHDFFSCI